MSEIFETSETQRNPETPYAFESSGDDKNMSGLLGGLAYAYCTTRCPALERVEQAGLACPFMVTEHSQGQGEWDPSDPSLAMLGEVADNTWMHCVDDVKNGGEPVILLDLKTT